jgi:hypothetical protein
MEENKRSEQDQLDDNEGMKLTADHEATEMPDITEGKPEETSDPDMPADSVQKVEETQVGQFKRTKKPDSDVEQPGDDMEQPGDAAGVSEELQLPPEELPAEPPEGVDDGRSEETPAEATAPAESTGKEGAETDAQAKQRRLRARVKAHVEATEDIPDLTTEEAYAEVKDTEDLNYDLREDCREIERLLQQVGSGKFAVGEYLIARHWPPLQVTRFGHIYWQTKPKPRYRELIKFPELPCSKSELQDAVQLALQKRSLDELNQGNPGYCNHMSVSQLILLTRVKDLREKVYILQYLKKHPMTYVQMKEWMRAKGYLKAAKEVDQTKKLILSFERLVQNAEESLPALEDTDPNQIGFNLLGSWRQRLGAVVSLLQELEEEEEAA